MADRDLSTDELHRSENHYRLLVEGVRDYAIFLLDPKGIILTWNAGAESLTGYEPHEVIGHHFSLLYSTEALRSDLPAFELAVAEREGRIEDDGWRIRKDGKRFWANVIIAALRNEQGEHLGFSKITRDLTQQREYEESLRQSEERFRLLVEGVTDYAIFMLDANGHVVTWNAGAQRISGYSAQEIIGSHFSTFYPQEARDSSWPEHELTVAAATGRFDDEGQRLRKGGETFHARVTITSMRDSRGRLIGFAKLTRDLTERRRVEALETAGHEREQLLRAERSARMAAQRATRLKDEFLATLSHELRTPLSAILGWTQILGTRLDSTRPEDLRRAIEVIDRNARAQVQLIDDLLDMSRVMAGKVRLEMRATNLQEVVTSAVESCEPTARAKGVTLELTLDPVGAVVSADAERLQQVVWNLLSNAVKFTPQGGRIRVVMTRVGDQVELAVTDTGVGIPAPFLDFVFDRFSQKDSSVSRSFGGLGLGLAICKQLMELHGGGIRASSPGEGQGATFVVTLPLVSGPPSPPNGPLHPIPSHGGEPSVVELGLPRLEGARIVVIDDERDSRELLVRILRDQGAEVTDFACAKEALAHLGQLDPAVIVSDIGMPGMDGLQFMRALRAGETRAQRVPAVALTAFARAEDRKRTLLAGYQAHVSKPFDVTELLLVVADLAGR